MNIAIIAHDSKKELMVQFCIAYCRVLSQHNLIATGTTGKMVAEATGLSTSRSRHGSPVTKSTCCFSSETLSRQSRMSRMS